MVHRKVEEVAVRDAALLVAGADMAAPQSGAIAFGVATWFTAAAPGKGEEGNQDALALIPTFDRCGVLAVADGLGGTAKGAAAARIALEVLVASLRDYRGAAPESSVRPAILDGLERADAQIKALGVGAGATIVVAELRDERLRAYHAGDAHLVACGQRGRILLQTIPHSPVGYAVEAGVLDDEAAMFHGDRHLVSNYLGSPEMRIDLSGWVPLSRHDRIVLGSDGLFDNLRPKEVIDAVRCGPLAEGAATLRSLSQWRMGREGTHQPSKPDDLSFIVFGR